MAILKVEDLSTYYETSAGYNQALDDFSLELMEGETLGLIGESGCGKSTVGFSLLNMVQYPGRVMKGKVLLKNNDMMSLSAEHHRQVLWRDIALIPQSAMNSLNPVYRVGQQIIETLQLHFPKLPRQTYVDKAKSLLKQVGLDEKIFDVYPHKLSGGMKQRAIIAMALSCDPTVIISDESTTGLDVLIQAQILALLKRLQRERNLSLIIISHDLHMVAAVCDRIGVMYAGHLVELASTEKLQTKPLHPYTQALFASNIGLDDFDKRVDAIEGVVPKLINPDKCCRFVNRCTQKQENCANSLPQLIEVEIGHFVACSAWR